MVVGLLERDNKVKTTIYKSSEKTLKDMIKEHVNNDAVIVTDSLNAYIGFNKHFAGDEVVNHNIERVCAWTMAYRLNRRLFNQLKRSIYGIYHQVSPKHLQRYCVETAYRYNTRRTKNNERFEITILKAEGRLKYSDLISKS